MSQTRTLERLSRAVDDFLALHDISAKVTGGQTNSRQHIVFDAEFDGDSIAQGIRRLTGANSCVIRLQIGLVPPSDGWR